MMSAFIGFLFNPLTLESVLVPKWNTIMDHEYVQTKMIRPMLEVSHQSGPFLAELFELSEKGQQIIKKSKKKSVTQIEPFLLTMPKVRRKHQNLEQKVQKLKATAIPKTLFKESRDMVALQKVKLANRQRAEQGLLLSKETEFRAAKATKSNRIDILRQELISQEKEEIEKSRVKQGSIPHFQPVHVKLTTAQILREDMLLRKKQEEQERQINDVEIGLRDIYLYESLKQEANMKEKMENQLHMEQKRLEIQLHHEETWISRQEAVKKNKYFVFKLGTASN